MQKVLVLINLGTPKAPDPDSVGVYLDEFLMDRWVLQMPLALRALLVKVAIVPRRKYASSENYKKIWTQKGSPLLVYSEALKDQVQSIAPDVRVELAMRYGEPSIGKVMERLQKDYQERGGIDAVVVPLYPQYAESSYRTAKDKWEEVWRKMDIKGNFFFVPPFFDRVEFISAWIEVIKKSLGDSPVDHFLFSYHSIPELHIRRTEGERGHCLRGFECCEEMSSKNKNCYRAHCFHTTRGLVRGLGLKEGIWSMSFQSRLGPTKWLTPSTEERVRELARSGVKRLGVVCPSFVSDCLETLEEIGEGLRELFLKEGGEEFRLIPCLNDNSTFAKGLVSWSQEIWRDAEVSRVTDVALGTEANKL